MSAPESVPANARKRRDFDGARRALVFVLICLTFGTATALAVDVVANPSVPDLVLKRSTAWAVFSMRLRAWSDGSPTTVFVLADSSPVHAEFSKTILDTFPYQLRRAWDRLVFSGTGQAPIEVKSVAEMRERILSTPGSVGYLPAQLVDKSMKKVRVE
jgi:hypothetical protein